MVDRGGMGMKKKEEKEEEDDGERGKIMMTRTVVAMHLMC